MKFSDYIQKQADEFRRAGDGYESLSDTSKSCIDYAVQRYIDEHAGKQQAIEFVEWVQKHYFLSDLTGKWLESSRPLHKNEKITQELYNQFIEQQNKS